MVSRTATRITLLVLLIVVLGSAALVRAQSATPVTLVKAARLLDPRTGNILANELAQSAAGSAMNLP